MQRYLPKVQTPSPLSILVVLSVFVFLAALVTFFVLAIQTPTPNIDVNAALYFNGAYTLPVNWSSVTHLSADLAPVLSAWTPSQDFTIEWFQNIEPNTNIPRIFSLGSNENTLLAASLQGPKQNHTFLFWQTVDVYQTPIFTTIPVQETFTHMALVRQNNTATTYCNGKQIGSSFAFPFDFSTATNTSLTLGNYAPNYSSGIDGILTGYISNFRITDGALYTSSFQVPSTPLPSVTAYPVSFLLQVASSATAIVDSGIYSIPVENVGVQFTTGYP